MAKVKAKRSKKAERAASQKAAAVDTSPPSEHSEDSMTQCVALCQQERWREACQVCLRMRDRANRSGKTDLYASLGGAFLKIDYSLRRQMAAALLNGAKDLLAKEYLLDVGE